MVTDTGIIYKSHASKVARKIKQIKELGINVKEYEASFRNILNSTSKEIKEIINKIKDNNGVTKDEYDTLINITKLLMQQIDANDILRYQFNELLKEYPEVIKDMKLKLSNESYTTQDKQLLMEFNKKHS